MTNISQKHHVHCDTKSIEFYFPMPQMKAFFYCLAEGGKKNSTNISHITENLILLSINSVIWMISPLKNKHTLKSEKLFSIWNWDGLEWKLCQNHIQRTVSPKFPPYNTAVSHWVPSTATHCCVTVTTGVIPALWLKSNTTNHLPLIDSSLLQYIFNVGHSHKGTPIGVIPGP